MRDSLFGKREGSADMPAAPNTTTSPLGGGSIPIQGGATTSASVGGFPRVGTPADRAKPVGAGPDAGHTSTNEVGSKLIVGPNIKLKGVEISDCDTLVVEGRVEATMNSRVIQIAEMGAFTGSAEVDLAEIRGDFEGELTVRQKLVIFGTGKVSGKIRYGKLVVEEGGQLSGDVQSGGVAAAPRSLSVAKAAQ